MAECFSFNLFNIIFSMVKITKHKQLIGVFVKKEYIISVDLGGTKILSALLNSKSEIVNRVKVETEIDKGASYIVESIAKAVNEIIVLSNLKAEEVKAICLGVPGTVNPNEGMIYNAPNLGVKNFNMKSELSKYFQIPVLLENDVNIAALGIKKYEFNDNVKNMLVVFVGTGIGAALIFDGKMYRGSSFFAGEIGHMKVSQEGKLGGKKVESTFETLASRTAIVNSIKKEIKKGKKSILTKLSEGKPKIKSKMLLTALQKKDKLVTKQLENAGIIIGSVLGSVTTLLNIDTIVIGGGVFEAMGEYLLPVVKDNFSKTVLPEPGKNVNIVLTKLGDDAPLFGGLSLAEEFLD